MMSIKGTFQKQRMKWTVTLTLMREKNPTASKRRTDLAGKAELLPRPTRCLELDRLIHLFPRPCLLHTYYT